MNTPLGCPKGLRFGRLFFGRTFQTSFATIVGQGFLPARSLCQRSWFWQSRFSAKGSWLKSPVFVLASFAHYQGCKVAHFFAVRVAWAVGCLLQGRFACEVAFWQKDFQNQVVLLVGIVNSGLFFHTLRGSPTQRQADPPSALGMRRDFWSFGFG